MARYSPSINVFFRHVQADHLSIVNEEAMAYNDFTLDILGWP